MDMIVAQETNEMEICFDAISANESFARVAVAAFIAKVNPTLEEISDIKTAVSEAVTNAIIHGYENFTGYESPSGKVMALYEGDAMGDCKVLFGRENHPGKVRIHCLLEGGMLHIEISDNGKGIEDIEQAMEPLFTTKPELERSGMGFAFMEAFMDDLEVESIPGQGTTVRMIKKMNAGAWIEEE